MAFQAQKVFKTCGTVLNMLQLIISHLGRPHSTIKMMIIIKPYIENSLTV